VLCVGQTVGGENGIYTVAAGPWVRRADWDHVNNVKENAMIAVTQGGFHDDSLWRLTTAEPYAIGTTALVFEKITGDQPNDDTNLISVAGEHFVAPAGGGLGGHWTYTDRLSAGGAIVGDFSAAAMGGYDITSDGAAEQQIGVLDWGDGLAIPLTAVSNTVVEFGFEITRPGGNDAGDDFRCGLTIAYGVDPDAITDSLWIACFGANADLLIEGDDGTTEVSFDSGLDFVAGQMVRVRIDAGDLAAVVFWIDVGGGLGWQRIAQTVSVPLIAAAVQPFFFLEKDASANANVLEIKYFNAWARYQAS
jgi:hypothetical protein